MKIQWEATYNFNKKGLRGANFEVLPFLRIFPPGYLGGYARKSWSIHLGWLWWTILVHTY